MSNYVSVYDGPYPGVLKLRFPYDQSFVDALHPDNGFPPGCKYAPQLGRGAFQLAEELLAPFKEVAARYDLGVEFFTERPETRHNYSWMAGSTMFPWQKTGVERITEHTAQVLAFDPGLGKTRSAIEAVKILDDSGAEAPKILIVCPAIARPVWWEEIPMWWKGYPAMQVVKKGAEARRIDHKNQPAIIVTTYNLVKNLGDLYFDAIIFDEIHYIKDGRRKRSEVCAQLRRANPEAVVVGLTGTPITSKVPDLWHELDCLWPGRFGTYWQFINRYCIVEPNIIDGEQRGHTIEGTQNETELRDRLATCLYRVTKEDVERQWPGTLPPMSMSRIRLDSGMRKKDREALDLFEDQHRVHKKKYSAFLDRVSDVKIDAALQWVEDQMEAGQEHACLLTYTRDTAKELVGLIEDKGIGVPFLVTGEQGDAEKRKTIIDSAAKTKRSVVVATIRAVGTGINNLVFCSVAGFVELDASLGSMEQAIDRFHRLRSTDHVHIVFFCAKGTIDDAIAYILRNKQRDADAVTGSSSAGGKLGEALKRPKRDLQVELRKAVELVTYDDGDDLFSTGGI